MSSKTPGDALVEFGQGWRPTSGCGGVTHEQVADELRPLLALPVEVVLPRMEHQQTPLGSSARS